MTVEAWTRTPTYTIAGIGPYAITHPYTAGAVRAYVVVAGVRVLLTGSDYTLNPTSSEVLGDLFLSPAAAATHAGRTLIIDRVTTDEQGWVGTQGEREKGLERQLDRITQALQEVRADTAGAIRTRNPLAVLDWVEGTVPILQGGAPVSGPTATDIANSQVNAIAAANAATAAAASALQASLFVGPRFTSLTELISSALTYTTGQPGTVTAGQLVLVKGRAYIVLSLVAVDPDITTIGGVRLDQEADGQGAYDIEGYTGTDTQRIGRFIRKTNALGGYATLNFDGTKAYSVPAQITERITGQHVKFEGNGARITIDKGEVFRFGDGAGYPQGGVVRGFRVIGAAGTDATSKFVRIDYAGQMVIDQIWCNGVACLVDSDPVNPTVNSNSDIKISNIAGSFANIANCNAFRRGRTYAYLMDKVVVFNVVPGGGVAAPGRTFLDDSGSTSRSTITLANVLAERFYIGLRIAPTGAGFIDYIFNNLILDSMYHTAWVMECGAGGLITSIIGTNVWAVGLAAVTAGVTNVNADMSARFTATAAGAWIGAIHLTNCWFNGGFSRNLQMQGGIRNVVLGTSQFASYEAPQANKVMCYLDNSQGRMEDIKIIGNNIGGQRNTFTTFNADQGLVIDGTTPIKGLQVTGNTLAGQNTQLGLPTFASADRSMLVCDNVFVGPGTTFCGWKSGGAFVVPATNVLWINTTAQPIEVTVSGGTLTQLLLLDALSNTQVNVPFSGTYRLNPGDGLTPTYSAAPVWQFRVVN